MAAMRVTSTELSGEFERPCGWFWNAGEPTPGRREIQVSTGVLDCRGEPDEQFRWLDR
jgi:hypothetical protein